MRASVCRAVGTLAFALVCSAASAKEDGKYLTTLGDCAGCHTNTAGPPFAGGRALEVGMRRVLVAHGVRADLVVGASVGAINAAYYAGRPSPEGVAELVRIPSTSSIGCTQGWMGCPTVRQDRATCLQRR
jgi:mono/diheme cytochrome c family protein